MSNYYEILGVQPAATTEEIKAAFRRLAKKYHPDHNPAGAALFSDVLRAYETLVDPARRATYDYRIANNLPQRDAVQKSATKTWSFSEKELKRRQYYNEHIRKYAKATATYNAEAESKKQYNEFKYVLFALPLAVALFILIMRLAIPDRKLAPAVKRETGAANAANEIPPPKQGDSPYAGWFGDAVYDTGSKSKLEVRNHTGEDVVVCLFSDSLFIRSFFMEDGYAAEVMQLPETAVEMRYASGMHFDYLLKPPGTGVHGAFSGEMKFYRSVHPVFAGSANAITLAPGENPGFEPVDAAAFFIKKKSE